MMDRDQLSGDLNASMASFVGALHDMRDAMVLLSLFLQDLHFASDLHQRQEAAKIGHELLESVKQPPTP